MSGRELRDKVLVLQVITGTGASDGVGSESSGGDGGSIDELVVREVVARDVVRVRRHDRRLMQMMTIQRYELLSMRHGLCIHS
jgi:hypothetical protein